MNKNIILPVVLALLLSACESGSSSGSSETDAPPLTAIGAGTGEATALEGTWFKECSLDSSEEDGFYETIELKFSGNTIASDIKIYEDADCTVPFDFAPNPTASGVFLVGESVVTTDGVQATEFDTHITVYDGAEFDIYEYDIFYIQGGELYFGELSGELDASSPSARPDTLDFERTFYKL